jgi:hypothetical protein
MKSVRNVEEMWNQKIMGSPISPDKCHWAKYEEREIVDCGI